MTPEEIAQKYENRPGFQLVDYAEVGLPIYRLWIDVVSLERRELPSVQEFILRLLESGVGDAPTVSGILGLDGRVFELSINALFSKMWIAEEGRNIYAMTKKGRDVLEEGADISPQDETIAIDFDGITREPVNLGREVVAKPSELRSAGKIEIRPYPASSPQLDDLDLRKVQKALEARIGKPNDLKEVLSINRIARKSRLFRSAIALLFKSDRSKNVELDFVINGALSEDHSVAFARNDGPTKMGIQDSVSSGDIRQTLKAQIGQDARGLLADDTQVSNVRVEVAASKMLLESAKQKAARAKGARAKAELTAKLENAEQRHERAKNSLDDFPVRSVAVYEYPAFLADALENAEHSIIVSSTRILDTIVDGYFLRSINVLLDRHVDIALYINGGWLRNGEQGNGVVSQIKELSKRNAGISLRRTRKSPVNWLICDDRFAVVSSFPWLSYRDSKRPLRRMQGLMVQDSGLVGRLRETFRTREVSE
ncbi:hypothetical protein [Pelagibius sp.]|uniref:hypothetical protein n=1 Tax=Pelagibius sp. TaxID=1931238 RepID=UPI003B511AC1